MSALSIARQKMVDSQVRPNDVTDRGIIDAMLTVPRESFVPASQQGLAYLDLDLDVSGSGGARRFLIKPLVTAKLLQATEITETDNVLIVGCATGYIAALVAKLTTGKIVATEPESTLAAKAKEVLTGLGFPRVTLSTAACPDGDPAGAPYDVIILNGATEVIPERLLQQIKRNGRLVGVFATSAPQHAAIVTRSNGEFGHRTLFDATAPVLPGLERTPAFVF